MIFVYFMLKTAAFSFCITQTFNNCKNIVTVFSSFLQTTYIPKVATRKGLKGLKPPSLSQVKVKEKKIKHRIVLIFFMSQ